MRAAQEGRHVIRYTQEKSDRVQEAIERLARIRAAQLDDGIASTVADLFDEWSPGMYYARGVRIADGEGNLYRVEQDHTSQADWPISSTPSLYTPLGVTEEDPEAIPLWRQPLGAHDAYPKGAKVEYEGAVYVSLVDGNVWPPDTPGMWQADSTQR